MDRGIVYFHLDSLFYEVNAPDWDGYNAMPVSKEVLRSSKRVIGDLPVYIEDPSVGAEPDGCITLEWYRGQDHLLSLSIGPAGLIAYAGILDGRKVGGGVFVDNLLEVPRLLVEHFSQPSDFSIFNRLFELASAISEGYYPSFGLAEIGTAGGYEITATDTLIYEWVRNGEIG